MADEINKKPLNHPESVALNQVKLMAQQSLCPEYYDMFCKVNNRLVENRRLQNEKFCEDEKPNPITEFFNEMIAECSGSDNGVDTTLDDYVIENLLRPFFTNYIKAT